MFDPYSVKHGDVCDISDMNRDQLDDARLKLARRGLGIQTRKKDANQVAVVPLKVR